MAARTITMDELGAAVKEYAARHELTVSSNEKGFCLMPGDVVIALQDGKPSCSNAEILDSLIEILMDLAEEPARAPQKPNLPARPANTKAVQRNGQILPNGESSTLTLEKVREYFCETATDEECAFALEVCAIRGLNPFKRDCFFVKYGGANPKLEIIVSKDFFMKKAMTHPDFEYFKAGVTVQKGEEVANVERYYAYPGESLLGGWAEVKRKSIKVPFRAEIPLSGFKKESKFWNSQPGPGHMIRKCAGSTVLREAFSEDFAGLYDENELGLDPANEVGA